MEMLLVEVFDRRVFLLRAGETLLGRSVNDVSKVCRPAANLLLLLLRLLETTTGQSQACVATLTAPPSLLVFPRLQSSRRVV